MPALFANLAASKSWYISSQKIAQLRFEAPGNKNGKKSLIIIQFRIKYL
jgi:hypothetical protein